MGDASSKMEEDVRGRQKLVHDVAEEWGGDIHRSIYEVSGGDVHMTRIVTHKSKLAII